MATKPIKYVARLDTSGGGGGWIDAKFSLHQPAVQVAFVFTAKELGRLVRLLNKGLAA